MMMIVSRKYLTLLCCLPWLLTGCELAGGAAAGYAVYKVASQEPARPPQETPTVFCYSTLARPDCYPYPVDAYEPRLLAYDGTAVTPKQPPASPTLWQQFKGVFE